MTTHDKIEARAKRGQIPAGFEKKFEAQTQKDLILLLAHEDAQIRTAAAILLGQQKCVDAVSELCHQFSKETTLYSRIAQSKALGEIGLPALPHLINLIGKIGHNQHHALPENLFRKWNYPIPRDIAARTIVKMGPAALPILLKTLEEQSDPMICAECIDAVGYINYYSKDYQGFQTLKMLWKKYDNHLVIQWKLIRALQAFPQPDSIELLKEIILTSPIPQHRWEAVRSLGQTGTHQAKDILQSIENEGHPLVQEMIQRSLDHLENH
jgi:hypothetical protein